MRTYPVYYTNNVLNFKTRLLAQAVPVCASNSLSNIMTPTDAYRLRRNERRSCSAKPPNMTPTDSISNAYRLKRNERRSCSANTKPPNTTETDSSYSSKPNPTETLLLFLTLLILNRLIRPRPTRLKSAQHDHFLRLHSRKPFDRRSGF